MQRLGIVMQNHDFVASRFPRHPGSITGILLDSQGRALDLERGPLKSVLLLEQRLHATNLKPHNWHVHVHVSCGRCRVAVSVQAYVKRQCVCECACVMCMLHV